MNKPVIVVTAVVLVGVVAIGSWLVLRGGGEVTARGACESATYEFTAEHDEEGLELSFELQSTAPDETWTVEVLQGDTPLLSGERQTDEDGELDVDALGDQDGSDEFTVTATQAPDGAPCVASLTR